MSSTFRYILTAWIINALSLVILPYLWYLFWKLRHHFLISARFPKVTLLMSILMFVAVTASSINSYTLNLYNFDKNKAISSTPLYAILLISIMTFSFLFCAWIIFRAFLIYDQWNKEQDTLNNQTHIIMGSMDVSIALHAESKQASNRVLKYIIITILSLAFIFFCLTIPGLLQTDENNLQRSLFPFPFIIIMLLGIFILIRARKMKESVLCKQETYMIGIIIISQTIFDNLPLPHGVLIVSGVTFGMLFIHFFFCLL